MAINNTIQRGDPIIRREDCFPFDFGLIFNDIQDFSNQVITSVWSPNGDFQRKRQS